MTCCSERKDDSPCYECLLESVQRVRELAQKFEAEPIDEIVNYRLAGRRILKALDGEH